MKTIILLDLNYTLVSNSEKKAAPFTKQIEREVYRRELIDLVKPHYTILITARPARYRALTLAHIVDSTDWYPDESYFNNMNLPPHLFKKRMFIDGIQSNHSKDRFLAIESNPKTIAEYKKLGVECLSVQ